MLKLLFDADMLVYRATSAAETEIYWGNDLWTLHSDTTECKEKIDNMVVSITDRVLNYLRYEGDYEIIMCFSDKDNFRKKLLPSYKANRAGKRKPLAYSFVMRWVIDNFTCLKHPGLEADDIIGIMATKSDSQAVIISGDKDMRCIPGIFYDFIHNEFYTIDNEQADYWHLYQTLVGDSADNYKGCPKVGEVGARKILDKEATWESVMSAYNKAGVSEEDALVQARVARILRFEDITDETNMTFSLWKPKVLQK